MYLIVLFTIAVQTVQGNPADFMKDALGNLVKGKIDKLPGFHGKMPSNMYSGYLHASATTRLFYVFVEAEEIDPDEAPMTAWFNGGPGSSSLDGFWEELGPFEVKKDGTLELRPYRWNRLSNMLFIESPVGVGLSYSLDENYINNDDRTAVENAEALNYFFKNLFPNRVKNKFYLTGESYAVRLFYLVMPYYLITF